MIVHDCNKSRITEKHGQSLVFSLKLTGIYINSVKKYLFWFSMVLEFPQKINPGIKKVEIGRDEGQFYF